MLHSSEGRLAGDCRCRCPLKDRGAGLHNPPANMEYKRVRVYSERNARIKDGKFQCLVRGCGIWCMCHHLPKRPIYTYWRLTLTLPITTSPYIWPQFSYLDLSYLIEDPTPHDTTPLTGLDSLHSLSSLSYLIEISIHLSLASFYLTGAWFIKVFQDVDLSFVICLILRKVLAIPRCVDNTGWAILPWRRIQGDTAACTQPPVDLKVEVAFLCRSGE